MTDSPLFDTTYAILKKIQDNLKEEDKNKDPDKKFNFEIYRRKHEKYNLLNFKPSAKVNYLFSYREDFSSLWDYSNDNRRLAELIACEDNILSTTIIIWDGYPEKNNIGSISVENWVTPIDWAVCAALSFDKEKIPNWRVLIIDLISQNYPGSQSGSLLKANPALIPWIRLYRPVLQNMLTKWKDQFAAESDRWYALLRAMAKDDFVSLLEDIQAPERVLGLNSSSDTLESLASIWRANIVRPGDRHQVANMIAPLILFEGIRDRKAEINTKDLGDEIYSPLTFALAEELKTLQLIAVPEGGKRNATLRLIEEIRTRTTQIKDLQIILLDDQYSLGYDKILEYIIAGTATVEFRDTQKDIIDRLKAIFNIPVPIKTPGWRQPIFDMPTILLLDLRLWANAATMKTFYEDLKSLMAEYMKYIEEDVDDQRKHLLDDWREVKEQIANYPDRENLLALTILPRLLSVIDPFLPIILFSSSAQRQTLEAFEGYPNIITEFKKPMPTGYGAGISPVEYLEDLSFAFERAINLCNLTFMGDKISDFETSVFLRNMKLVVDGFINPVDGEFDPNMVCNDLRKACRRIQEGHYRLGFALPFFLLERWYKMKTGNKWLDVKPMKSGIAGFDAVKETRQKFAHGDSGFFCLEKGDEDLKTVQETWEAFFSLIKLIA